MNPRPTASCPKPYQYFTSAERAIRRLATAAGDSVIWWSVLECGDCGAIHIHDHRDPPPAWRTRRTRPDPVTGHRS